ncbi:hypothetical protein [Clostridium felsineum]|uniref:Uncharacterized protein n=1 Tax=Clostridium felsineum TaxID=36839 RepID=A0A1S8MDQ9_9CLOT|nr:hypothetical protein [Clostridium felsineum]MCR3760384.1 hypothetical protein [Clostridium felsineum]URZ06441.1 hypothetical protein CLROS_017740 [Clostridium felsineum]URZ11476.1 hypothetical protein CROST_021930 [Clostridium felsineum]
MLVTVKALSKKALEEREYRDKVQICMDGKEVFNVMDDEPEDSNLSRSFSDVYKIPKLLEKAYKAGKNGEELKIEYEEVEEI